MSVKLRDFNEVAARWDQKPRRVLLARTVTEAIIREAQPAMSMRCLDFGCGTGLVTLALAPLVHEMFAADSSTGMLEQLAAKLVDADISNVSTLALPHEGTIQWPEQLDMIVSSMTMHHISDVGRLIMEFYAILAPGGQLCIADLETEDGSFHDDPTGIQHHGFARDEMERFFREAGFSSIRTMPVMDVKKERDEQSSCYPVNLTIGRRDD